MTTYLVTGAAGFIASHLTERLLREGHKVLGIDCFTDYYPRWIKELNLRTCLQYPEFSFLEANILNAELSQLLQSVDVVFHLAAQAGVRASWGDSFQIYTNNNILATQRLLEATRASSIKKFIYASSSSVYGDTQSLPMREDHPVQPISPYGVSKLAGEQLGILYHTNYGTPFVGLRFFTVYGPRQRPDMGFHRFCAAVYDELPLSIYGDGEQTRDFTYVDDIVEAALAASRCELNGVVFNIGGGHRVTVNQVLDLMATITARPVKLNYIEAQKGDMRHTYADTSFAQKTINYQPRCPLALGLARQWTWYQELRRTWASRIA